MFYWSINHPIKHIALTSRLINTTCKIPAQCITTPTYKSDPARLCACVCVFVCVRWMFNRLSVLVCVITQMTWPQSKCNYYICMKQRLARASHKVQIHFDVPFPLIHIGNIGACSTEKFQFNFMSSPFPPKQAAINFLLFRLECNFTWDMNST
jgi:hypothetical protein